jgi:hypothetical protein
VISSFQIDMGFELSPGLRPDTDSALEALAGLDSNRANRHGRCLRSAPGLEATPAFDALRGGVLQQRNRA